MKQLMLSKLIIINSKTQFLKITQILHVLLSYPQPILLQLTVFYRYFIFIFLIFFIKKRKEKSDSLNITNGYDNKANNDVSATEISNKTLFVNTNMPNLFQQKLIIKNLMKKEFGNFEIYPKGFINFRKSYKILKFDFCL